MTNSWAQFEANLRQALGRDGSEEEKKPRPTSSSSLLKKHDLFLFGSGSVSNLLVVSCHVCGALIKPAFLAHHINKLHGTTSEQHKKYSKPSSSKQSLKHHFKNPPIHKQIKHIKQTAIQCKRKTPSPPKEDHVKVTIKYPQAPPAPPQGKPKRKESKRKETKKKEDKRSKKVTKVEEKDSELLKLTAFSTASPPPSPPALYPSPTRTPFFKAKRKIPPDPKVEVKADEAKVKCDVFDFKTLIKQLPHVNPNGYFQQIPNEATRERRNGLVYQHQKPRSLGSSQYGGRSMGRGETVFTRRSDHLRAALNALLPNQATYKCTSEMQTTTASTAIENSSDMRHPQDLSGFRSTHPPDLSDSFSSSRQNSPSFDIFDSDLDKPFPDDFLSDMFSWTDYGDPSKLSNKLFSNSGTGNKSNIPKLKVDSNQIKSKSAMAVFEFDDPEEGRRAREEERIRLLRAGTQPLRKNKRKLVKSPSQVITPSSNGSLDNSSPSSVMCNKRGKYEVIELDKSPSPVSSPIKHCVSSPRQFSFMIGYSEQSAT